MPVAWAAPATRDLLEEVLGSSRHRDCSHPQGLRRRTDSRAEDMVSRPRHERAPVVVATHQMKPRAFRLSQARSRSRAARSSCLYASLAAPSAEALGLGGSAVRRSISDVGIIHEKSASGK